MDKKKKPIHVAFGRGLSSSAVPSWVQEKHKVPFRFEKYDGTPLPYRMQGDKKMYTKKSLAKRKALREDMNVKIAINEIWKLIPKGSDNARILTKEGYERFYMRVCKLLNPDLSFDKAQQIVKADFEKDSKGKGQLDFHLFQSSLFELVDNWTLGLSVKEYLDFLNGLAAKLNPDEYKPE